MREQIRYLLRVVGFKPEEMREIALESFRRAEMPEHAAAEFIASVQAWPAEDIENVPICDLHTHLAGSIPFDHLRRLYETVVVPGKELGKAQNFIVLPPMKTFVRNGSGQIES